LYKQICATPILFGRLSRFIENLGAERPLCNREIVIELQLVQCLCNPSRGLSGGRT